MTILLAGATGLVGSRVLALLPEAIPVGRRATGRAGEIVADFAALPPLPPARVAISALGTTIRAAGSQAAFRAVDHDAVLSFARAAKAAGVDALHRHHCRRRRRRFRRLLFPREGRGGARPRRPGLQPGSTSSSPA